MKTNLIFLILSLHCMVACSSVPDGCDLKTAPPPMHISDSPTTTDPVESNIDKKPDLNLLAIYVTKIGDFSNNVIIEVWYEKNNFLVKKTHSVGKRETFFIPHATGKNFATYSGGSYTLKQVNREDFARPVSATFIRKNSDKLFTIMLVKDNDPKRKSLQTWLDSQGDRK